jgi:selenide,water dikinase
MLLFDPQTSGGLLLAVPASRQEAFMERAKEINLPVWTIGEAVEGEGIEILSRESKR